MIAFLVLVLLLLFSLDAVRSRHELDAAIEDLRRDHWV